MSMSIHVLRERAVSVKHAVDRKNLNKSHFSVYFCMKAGLAQPCIAEERI